jgi:hypothetical protein
MIMVVHHASIWRFPDTIKKENQVRLQIMQLQGGHTMLRDPVNKRYQANQRQVEAIVGQYAEYKEEGNILQYLRGIGYHLKTGPVVTPEQEPDGEVRTRH